MSAVTQASAHDPWLWRKGEPASALAELQGRHAAVPSATELLDDRGDDEFCATTQHLEERLAVTSALGDAAARARWLQLYVRYLAAAGDERRLRSLAERLLAENDATVIAHFKDTLLPVIARNAQLQGLVSELVTLLPMLQ